MNRLSTNADSFSSRRAGLGSLFVTVAVAVAVAPACQYDGGGVAYEPPPNAEPLLGCNEACHGDTTNLAPPNDLQGNTDTALISVGAHRAHAKVNPGWHMPVGCADCHKMPDGVDDPEHMDGDNVAELTFSPRSTGNGASETTWANGQCTNSYCHGATTPGGGVISPLWTEPTGQPLACDSCHGFPPPPPHAQDVSCGGCHTTVNDVPSPGPDQFVNPDSHIDGKVDTKAPDQQDLGCDSCHGSEGQPAPPMDLGGNNDVTSPGVGAHRAHVGGSNWRPILYCTQCHVTPINNDDPGHIDGDNVAEINFDGLNPNATYSGGTCSNLYCHGNGRTQNGTEVWNQDVPDLRNNCSACHGDNGEGMSGRHEEHLQSDDQVIDCNGCHYTVIGAQRNFIQPALHINGNHEVEMLNGEGTWDPVGQRCQDGPCHQGNKQWLKNGNGPN